jgi:hypothetical protein
MEGYEIQVNSSYLCRTRAFVEDHKVLKYTHVFGKMPHTTKSTPLGLFKDNASAEKTTLRINMPYNAAYFGQMRTFMCNVKDNKNAQKHNVSMHEAKMWSLRGV